MARTSEATFGKLVEFAEKGGDPSLVGSVIGNQSASVIEMYVGKLKREKPDLHAKFTAAKSVAPASIIIDDDDDDDDGFSLGDTPVETVVEKTPVTIVATPVVAPEPAKVVEQIPELPLGLPKKAADLFPRIRLRGSDGTTVDLTVFSENPGKFLILTIKERDLRTITIKGSPLTVDYAELAANPDGITNGYKNSDLKTVADLS